MAEHALEQTGQLPGQRRRVVDPAHQRIFEGDAAMRAGDVLLHRGQHLGDRIAVIDRHELGAQVIVRRVQADRQIDLQRLLGHLADALRQSTVERVMCRVPRPNTSGSVILRSAAHVRS